MSFACICEVLYERENDCCRHHSKAWKEKGMELGKLYEVALTVEGYQSQGTAEITSNELSY